MTINIEETGTGVLPTDLDCRATAELVTEGTARFVGAEYDLTVDILICDEEEIRQLNRDFRGMDQATDVLSFPNLEFEAPAVWPAEIDPMLLDPDSGELMLGNIAVCRQRILSQAEQYGHSARREYAFLITHSLLHLCGYDHIGDQEREQMEEAQRQILNDLGITRT